MDTKITIFTDNGRIDVDLSGMGYDIIYGDDGEKYLAISSLGMLDNVARICRASFKDCWREIFRKENLSHKEISKEWRKHLKVSRKIEETEKKKPTEKLEGKQKHQTETKTVSKGRSKKINSSS